MSARRAALRLAALTAVGFALVLAPPLPARASVLLYGDAVARADEPVGVPTESVDARVRDQLGAMTTAPL